MPPTRITVSQDQVLVAVGDLRNAVKDKPAILKNIAGLMAASIIQTFREEGSPAGSWPKLAASTMKNKRYTAGHKLLVLSNSLRTQVTLPQISGDRVMFGTNLPYAAVQQYGSAGGSTGPKSKSDAFAISQYTHRRPTQYVRKDIRRGKVVKIRGIGPSNAKLTTVRSHSQNIPARPYLVFRPEDPQRLVSGIDAYLRGRSKAVTP